MPAELLVRCTDETPKIPLGGLRQRLADSLESWPEVGSNGFAFDELGIAVSVALDENGDHTTARVQVTDRARIGHISEVFKTFVTLGWAL